MTINMIMNKNNSEVCFILMPFQLMAAPFIEQSIGIGIQQMF